MLRIGLAVPLPRIPYAQRRHRERVSALAVNLGLAFGLPVSALADLQVAAWAHDIGKSGIPAAVLARRGALTPGEFDLVRQHVLIGAEIVRRTGFPQDVVLAIRRHHERWDGTGYPDGLTDGRIPLFARIVAIADAYDVMTTGRPYRSAVSAEAALAELTRCAGTQFDPQFTRVFVSRALAAQRLWRPRGA